MTEPRRPTDATALTCDDVRDLAASFVLGALDADEVAAVRAHLASCPDAHDELTELAEVVPVLGESVPMVEPPAALKDRIMAAAAADLEERRGAAAPTAAPAVPSMTGDIPPAEVAQGPAAPIPFPTTQPRTSRQGTSAGTWAMRIAAVLAIALLGGWNLLLQGQLDAARTYEQNVAAVLQVAGQPGSLTAVLTGEGDAAPAGIAAVTAGGAVTIAMQALPATQDEQVYEAWVIAGDTAPVALGGFRVGADGLGYLESEGLPTDPGIVLALTLEPGPGAAAPSSPPVSAGTATAAG
jgi:anti-sigma-K factor RskA